MNLGIAVRLVMNSKEECIAVATKLVRYKDLAGFNLRGQMRRAQLLASSSGSILTLGGPQTSRHYGLLPRLGLLPYACFLSCVKFVCVRRMSHVRGWIACDS